MSASLFSAEEFIHLFPALFAILLCVISKFDHYWIDAKIQNEIGRGKTPDLAKIAATKQIANGAAALNIHLVNVLLFFAGAILAVFDWPRCMSVWPLATCIVLFGLILYDVLVTAVRIPFASFDRDPVPLNASRFRPWRGFKNWPPSARLRWKQISFNLVVILLVVAGVEMGGIRDERGICKAESPTAANSETLRESTSYDSPQGKLPRNAISPVEPSPNSNQQAPKKSPEPDFRQRGTGETKP